MILSPRPVRESSLPTHIKDNAATVIRHACKLGLEGIVSKRKDSPYRSGRSPDWLKMKNPACAAVPATIRKEGLFQHPAPVTGSSRS
jgi:ATP-dependent DNA ligase